MPRKKASKVSPVASDSHVHIPGLEHNNSMVVIAVPTSYGVEEGVASGYDFDDDYHNDTVRLLKKLRGEGYVTQAVASGKGGKHPYNVYHLNYRQKLGPLSRGILHAYDFSGVLDELSRFATDEYPVYIAVHEPDDSGKHSIHVAILGSHGLKSGLKPLKTEKLSPELAELLGASGLVSPKHSAEMVVPLVHSSGERIPYGTHSVIKANFASHPKTGAKHGAIFSYDDNWEDVFVEPAVIKHVGNVFGDDHHGYLSALHYASRMAKTLGGKPVTLRMLGRNTHSLPGSQHAIIKVPSIDRLDDRVRMHSPTIDKDISELFGDAEGRIRSIVSRVKQE